MWTESNTKNIPPSLASISIMFSAFCICSRTETGNAAEENLVDILVKEELCFWKSRVWTLEENNMLE